MKHTVYGQPEVAVTSILHIPLLFLALMFRWINIYLSLKTKVNDYYELNSMHNDYGATKNMFNIVFFHNLFQTQAIFLVSVVLTLKTLACISNVMYSSVEHWLEIFWSKDTCIRNTSSEGVVIVWTSFVSHGWTALKCPIKIIVASLFPGTENALVKCARICVT